MLLLQVSANFSTSAPKDGTAPACPALWGQHIQRAGASRKFCSGFPGAEWGWGGDTSSAPHIHIHSPLRRRAVGAVGWGGWRRAGSWKSLPADWRPRCHGDRPGGASRAAARAGDVTRPAPAGLGRPRLRRGAGVRGGEEGGGAGGGPLTFKLRAQIRFLGCFRRV